MEPSDGGNIYPSPSDIIEITWISTHTTEQVKVDSINNTSIKIQYLDNNDIEELQLDNGHLPFEWKLIEKHNSSPKKPIIQSSNHNDSYNNKYYNNKGNKWQPKSKPNQPQFTPSYNESNPPPTHQPQNENINKKPSKMKRKEVPQQRNIVRSVSAVTASTNTEYTEHTQPIEEYNNNNHTNNTFDKSFLPLKGDIISISYSGGLKNDPARIIHANYYGDARVRYTDAQGAENKINLFRNNDIDYTITNSVYTSPNINFIPAPRKGDLIEIRWIKGGGRDHVVILNVNIEYTNEYQKELDNKIETESEIETNEIKENENEIKSDNNINHFDKYEHIWVTFEYMDDKEQEKLDFHPNAIGSEILSWQILQCSNNAGLDLDINNEIKSELHNEICSVCCTSFGEFPYRTVVPCAHNNVCGKCTLRMRVFGDFTNDKHPYPMCPFCKESWEIVAFIPLEWTIHIHYMYEKNNIKIPLSKYEWNIVFGNPLEYDDNIQCYFTDTHTLQKFIHIRSLYCLFCYPAHKPISNYNKIYYYHKIGPLLGHIRHEHTSFMCELCLNNATLFMDEQRIFRNDKRLLIDHQRNGSKIEEQYGETLPHPFCTLCKQNFYSREQLYEHCENTHCSCHLCKCSGILEYYKHANVLKEHQRNLHHLCEHKECLAKLQPVVFDDPILLKSHQLQVHGWNKPMTRFIPGFTYGDEYYSKHSNETMNFSTMFTQTDINELNILNNNNINEEQRLRQRQKQMHRQMDQIKKRWFPNSYKKEQRQKVIKKLGLRHIPDAVPQQLRETKNVSVIKLIRKTLISQFNFKEFQIISADFSSNKIKSNIFFHRFKNLFEPLCDERIWVDILMQMLALLKDGVKRRNLYEEYRDWIIAGRVSKNTQIQSAPRAKYNNVTKNQFKYNNKPVKKNNKKFSIAALVAGTYKPPTKEQIMSERRVQKQQMRNKRRNVNVNVHKSSNVRGPWGKGAPKINNNNKVKNNNVSVPQVTSGKGEEVKQHWPTLGPAKAAPKPPPKWVDESVNNKKQNVKKQMNVKQIETNNSKNKKKKTKRGPRKNKKKKNKTIVEVNVVSSSNSKPLSMVNTNKKGNARVLRMTQKGKMPHELRNKGFNKSNPWGVNKNVKASNVKGGGKVQQQQVKKVNNRNDFYDNEYGFPNIIIKKAKSKKNKKKKKSKQ